MAALATVLLAAPGAFAQQQYPSSVHRSDELSGTVATIDSERRLVVFTDGRTLEIRQDTVITSDGREITFTTVKPGHLIAVRNAHLVTVQSGRVIRAPEPAPMVVQAPASSASVQVPQQKITVHPRAPEILVKSEAPEVVVEAMPAARMTVQGDSSALSGPFPAPDANTIVVPLPAQRMRVDLPRSAVVVQPPAPEIVLKSQPIQVAVQPTPQPQLSMGSGDRQFESALPQAAVSGPASVTTESGALTVMPNSHQMTVEIPRNRIVVKPSAPDVVVQNQAPQVTILPTPAPRLIYEGREITAGAARPLDQSSSRGDALVVTPPSQRVVVEVPRTVVLIQPQAPEIVLNAQPPEVLVRESPDPKLVMGEEQKVAEVKQEVSVAAAVPLREFVPVTGIVERTDPPKGILVLRDHNAVKFGPDVRFTMDARPVAFTDIKPGMLVTIYAPPEAWRYHSAQFDDLHVIEQRGGTAASTTWEPIYNPGEATPRFWELGRQSP